ncbi:transposase-like protein [Paraphaeosphaeria sporulosa]
MTLVTETFYKNTKSLEGNASSTGFGSLWQTIVNLQKIYAFLSGADELSVHQIEGFAQSEYMVSGVKLALEKFDTYIQKLVMPADDGAPSLYCDVADDTDELAELTRTRKVPGAYASDERRLRTIWVDDHLLTGKKAHKRQKRTSQLDEYFDSLYDDKLAASASPDLSQLLGDPHRWWTDVGQKRYPVVYKMAIDHFPVPVTSCDCERCFSSAERTITCDRNLLSPSVVEALQLQKNWLRRSAVSSYLTRLADHVVKKDARQNTQLAGNDFGDDLNTSHLPD